MKLRFVVGLSIVLASFGTQTALADPPEPPQQTADSIVRRGQYRTAIEVDDGNGNVASFPPAGHGGADQRRRTSNRNGRSSRSSRQTSGERAEFGDKPNFDWLKMPALNGLGGWFKVVAWIVLGLSLTLLLYFLIRAFLTRRGSAEIAIPSTNSYSLPPAEQVVALSLDDADRLAAEGKFREAILVLLDQALRATGWHAATEQSHTAREISSRVTDQRKTPLTQVVDIGEAVHFAGVEATLDRYHEARQLVQTLRTAQ